MYSLMQVTGLINDGGLLYQNEAKDETHKST